MYPKKCFNAFFSVSSPFQKHCTYILRQETLYNNWNLLMSGPSAIISFWCYHCFILTWHTFFNSYLPILSLPPSQNTIITIHTLNTHTHTRKFVATTFVSYFSCAHFTSFFAIFKNSLSHHIIMITIFHFFFIGSRYSILLSRNNCSSDTFLFPLPTQNITQG